jgi:hypothetical protein
MRTTSKTSIKSRAEKLDNLFHAQSVFRRLNCLDKSFLPRRDKPTTLKLLVYGLNRSLRKSATIIDMLRIQTSFSHLQKKKSGRRRANTRKPLKTTISGVISPPRTANVTLLYRLQGDANWTALTIVQTNAQGQYTYLWKPDKAGIYELRPSWPADQNTNPAESEPKPVKVEVQPTEAVPYVVAGVITIIVIIATAIYFVKIRKPK